MTPCFHLKHTFLKSVIVSLNALSSVFHMASSESAIQAQNQKLSSLGLTKTVVNAEHVNTYSRGLGSVSEDNPVLVLIHGYPQSSYE